MISVQGGSGSKGERDREVETTSKCLLPRGANKERQFPLCSATVARGWVQGARERAVSALWPQQIC